jgi:hypothetical protein
MPLIMDLTAMHANGCQLYLADVLKIVCPDSPTTSTLSMRHLDRETGKLTDCFTLCFACGGGDPVVWVVRRLP